MQKKRLAKKKKLAHEFEIKYLRRLKYFLGIEGVDLKQGILVSKQKYVLDLLKETRMIGSNLFVSPRVPLIKF